jgi:hypothetical protein
VLKKAGERWFAFKRSPARSVPDRAGPPPVETTVTKPAGKYSDFKVLLDDPAADPGLNFKDYAAAIAELITHSRAEFAIGIFGSWGSGKTTLMQAVKKALDADDSVVTVWFTAWRYEREPHLIVPLLDVLRETLDKLPQSPGWAQTAAVGVTKAGRAFLAGLTVSAILPGFQASLDTGKMIDAISAKSDAGPLSFYHAGFQSLRDAIRGLSAGGLRRVVVFVDDLDRCVPPKALDVLESMKLFFDVEGCIFVVGLDQEIVERAVAEKYAREKGAAGDRAQPTADLGSSETASLQQTSPTGAEYIKKLFQVPYTVPTISPHQLNAYLTSIEVNSDFADAQLADFKQNIRRHFSVLQGAGSVNPRELKRLVNIYTLQLKMLSARSAESVNPNVVLALLCMNFRPDWQDFYTALAADPPHFQSALRATLQDTQWPESVWLSGKRMRLPPGLPEYLRGEAADLLGDMDLEPYVSAAESTWSTDPSILQARTMVSRFRRSVDEVSDGVVPAATCAARISHDVERLRRLLTRREPAGRLSAMRAQLESNIGELQRIANEIPSDDQVPELNPADWADRAKLVLAALDNGLRELHRYLSVSAY